MNIEEMQQYILSHQSTIDKLKEPWLKIYVESVIAEVRIVAFKYKKEQEDQRIKNSLIRLQYLILLINNSDDELLSRINGLIEFNGSADSSNRF